MGDGRLCRQVAGWTGVWVNRFLYDLINSHLSTLHQSAPLLDVKYQLSLVDPLPDYPDMTDMVG